MGLNIDTSIIVAGQAIHDSMTCAICCSIQDAPTTICPSGHTYCATCISTWQEKSSSCPSCRCEIKAKFLNRPLQSIIYALKVKCSNQMIEDDGEVELAVTGSNDTKKRPAQKYSKTRSKSKKQKKSSKVLPLEDEEDADEFDKKPPAKQCCDWEGSLEDYLRSHQKECTFASVVCEKCSSRVKASELETHQETVCVIQCPYCKTTMPAAFVELHTENSCPNLGVSCPDCHGIVQASSLGTTTYNEKLSMYVHTGHQSSCEGALVCCEFQGMGCKVGGPMARKDLVAHHAATLSLHTRLAIAAVEKGWVSRRPPWQVCLANEAGKLNKGFGLIESNHVNIGKYKLFFQLVENCENDTVLFKLCSEKKELTDAPLFRNVQVIIQGEESFSVRIDRMRQLRPDLESLGRTAPIYSMEDCFRYHGNSSFVRYRSDFQSHVRRKGGLRLNVRFQMRDYDPRLASFCGSTASPAIPRCIPCVPYSTRSEAVPSSEEESEEVSDDERGDY